MSLLYTHGPAIRNSASIILLLRLALTFSGTVYPSCVVYVGSIFFDSAVLHSRFVSPRSWVLVMTAVVLESLWPVPEPVTFGFLRYCLLGGSESQVSR